MFRGPFRNLFLRCVRSIALVSQSVAAGTPWTKVTMLVNCFHAVVMIMIIVIRQVPWGPSISCILVSDASRAFESS